MVTTRIVRSLVFPFLLATALAAQVNPNLYAGLRWRNIGPFRGGRVSAVTGVVGQPAVFYAGLPGGGVWKTDDAGNTWVPIFDDVKEVSSIGAIEVAPSDPNIIYVGTGDLVSGGAVNEGNGMYKSTDAGKTWRHIGLDQTHQITTILVDPHDPKLVLAAAQGNIHAASQDRGIYRSTDGGETWKRVLFRSDSSGAQNMSWAHDHPNVIFATTVRHFTPPPTDDSASAGRGAAGGRGGVAGDTDTALYKSTDQGLTWTEITGGGLPVLTGRTGVAVAAHTDSQRVFLIGSFGLYRSDDGGKTWARSATDSRIVGSGYITGVYVNTQNPDVVYTMNTSMYRSTDGGHNFISFKGAPGGDDNHVLWIDPTNGDRILMGSDQGATLSLNGGRTWSSWYNQPTIQVYTIGVNNNFPYWVFGIQQDTDAVATRSRGDLGEITAMDWWPLPAWETGSVAADPLNPNIVYGGSRTSGMVRITESSWHWQYVGPNIGQTNSRTTNQPIVFSPTDPHVMYFGTQNVLATRDGGTHWTAISPDMSLHAGAATPAAGGGRGSAVNSIAPSPVKAGLIWAGTGNGIVQLTQNDGAHWDEVSPPGLHPWSVVEIEASHTNPAVAYIAVDQHGGADYAPHFYRTRDYGKNWQAIVQGLPTDQPSGSFARMIKEDTMQPGLLFGSTESSVYVSFDAGDHWQSLALNLPNTSYRDLRVHGNDLVTGTYGRSLYILDDISPLRQLAAANATALAAEPAHLFRPGDTIRAFRDVNEDSPLTPEMPHALNPPEGAIIYYYLSAPPTGYIKLEVLNSAQKIVRTYSSAPIPPSTEPPPPVPDYWVRKAKPMPTEIGTNRVNWDLRYEPPQVFTHNLGNVFAAIYEDTPAYPLGPMANPGTYTVRLTVNGKAYTQPLLLKNDPREGEAPAKLAALKDQLDLELKFRDGADLAYATYQQIGTVRSQLQTLASGTLPPGVADAATALDGKLAAVGGAGGRGGRGGGGGRGAAPAAGGGPQPMATLNGTLSSMIFIVSGASDAAPTALKLKAYQDDCTNLTASLNAWKQLTVQDLPAFNDKLRQANLQPLAVPTVASAPVCNAGGAAVAAARAAGRGRG